MAAAPPWRVAGPCLACSEMGHHRASCLKEAGKNISYSLVMLTKYVTQVSMGLDFPGIELFIHYAQWCFFVVHRHTRIMVVATSWALLICWPSPHRQPKYCTNCSILNRVMAEWKLEQSRNMRVVLMAALVNNMYLRISKSPFVGRSVSRPKNFSFNLWHNNFLSQGKDKRRCTSTHTDIPQCEVNIMKLCCVKFMQQWQVFAAYHPIQTFVKRRQLCCEYYFSPQI